MCVTLIVVNIQDDNEAEVVIFIFASTRATWKVQPGVKKIDKSDQEGQNWILKLMVQTNSELTKLFLCFAFFSVELRNTIVN